MPDEGEKYLNHLLNGSATGTKSVSEQRRSGSSEGEKVDLTHCLFGENGTREKHTETGSFYMISDIGKNPYRESNDDSAGVCPEKGLFVIADGFQAAGGYASKLAVRMVLERSNKDGIFLEDAIANEIRDKFKADECAVKGLEKSGSTLIAFRINGDKLEKAHLGDSRMYVFSADGTLKYISKDHSLAQEKIDEMGKFDKDKKNIIDRGYHVIMNGLFGQGELLDGEWNEVDHELLDVEHASNIAFNEKGSVAGKNIPTVTEIELQPGDIVLACSDGLYGEVVHERLLEMVKENSGEAPQTIGMKLANAALMEGLGMDNLTVLVYKHEKSVN